MGLAAELLADLQEAFEDEDGLKDAVVSFTLTQNNRDAGVYNTATGDYIESKTTYTGKGIPIGYDQQERFNTHIEPTDLELIVLVTDIGVVPQLRDEVVIGTKTYLVNKFEIDPLSAAYTLGLEGNES